MYWKIEPSGVCTVQRAFGLGIQVRYCIFLEETDRMYNERLVDEKIMVQVGTIIDPITNEIIPKYEAELTGNKLNVPLHNHLIPLEIDCTDDFIENIGNQVLAICKSYHNDDDKHYFDEGVLEEGEQIQIPNTIKCMYHEVTDENLLIAEKRIEEIKSNQKWQQ